MATHCGDLHDENPCLNGGQCYNSCFNPFESQHFTCMCDYGYGGTTCEQEDHDLLSATNTSDIGAFGSVIANSMRPLHGYGQDYQCWIDPAYGSWPETFGSTRSVHTLESHFLNSKSLRSAKIRSINVIINSYHRGDQLISGKMGPWSNAISRSIER